MLIFGYTSDHYSRKWSLFASTIILLIFAALSAGSYGAGGSSSGLFAALTAWRFLLGIGIGGEYPAGSVGCAESTGELKSGTRNRWFILFTNVQIDIGFVVSALVPMIVVCCPCSSLFTFCTITNRTFAGPLYRRRPPPRRLAHLSRPRRHPTSLPLVPSSQTLRARSLPPRNNGKSKDSLASGPEVLLVEIDYRLVDLVHLRFLRLLFLAVQLDHCIQSSW
jgi:MFS family permease